MLSEEAQEARHKHVKKFRKGHARKHSRKENMQDVLNLLLITSDPVISHISPLQKKKSDPIPQKVRDLLQQPDVSRKPRDADEDDDEHQKSEDEEDEGEEWIVAVADDQEDDSDY